MLEAFKHHIKQKFPFLLKTKVLIAVSGGLDSMVLLHLCKQSTMSIGVAHCNFQLRGQESDGDTDFVKNYCAQHHILFFEKYFDTSAYAKSVKTSTQIAARELRYQWFEELSVAESFDYILTGHHLNDDLETFLINLGRGTGINGLIGIPDVNTKIIRPLLKFSRKQIKEYALKKDIFWREDSSNSTDDYQRNHLRHHAIPNLEKAQSNILLGFQKTQLHLQQTASLLRVYVDQLREQLVIVNNGVTHIKVSKVLEHPEPKGVLYALLEPYGFKAWDDIYDLLNGQTGKQVLSPTYRILKDRDSLLITDINDRNDKVYHWEQGKKSITGDFGSLSTVQVTDVGSVSKLEIFVDESLIQFPLIIRTWEEGDFFYPYGMKGKKKLGKFYKDEKLSLIDKEKTWLLCQGATIIWVIGMRADDRFKVTEDTEKILKITVYDA